jgi:hypothetical protein
LGGIFISYRRADAAGYARLLQIKLRERFPDARVFMDLDSIEADLDFAKVIREAAAELCAGRDREGGGDPASPRRAAHHRGRTRDRDPAALANVVMALVAVIDPS